MLAILLHPQDDEIDECIYAHYLSLRTGGRYALCLMVDRDQSLIYFIVFNSSETPPNSLITHYWKFPGTHVYPIEEDCYETITLLESRTTIEAGTTGLRTWQASLVLAQYLIHHPRESQAGLVTIVSQPLLMSRPCRH